MDNDYLWPVFFICHNRIMDAKADPKEWFNNFRDSMCDLIQEAKKQKRMIQGIAVSQSIYDRMSEALGHRPNQLLGYRLEVAEFEEEETLKELMREADLDGEYEVEGYVDLIEVPLN